MSKGSYWTIKKANHLATGYGLNFKIYDKKKLTSKDEFKAIHREIYVLAGLNHTGVIRLYDVIDSDSNIILIIEECP